MFVFQLTPVLYTVLKVTPVNPTYFCACISAHSGAIHSIDSTPVNPTYYCVCISAHSGAIRSIDSHPSEPDIFLSTSQDGSILMWDLRNQKPVTKIGKILAAPLAVNKIMIWVIFKISSLVIWVTKFNYLLTAKSTAYSFLSTS